jgi:hypothetical protein
MERRRYLALAIATATAGCRGGDDERPAPTGTTRQSPTGTKVPGPEPLQFSGSGDRTVTGLSFPGGLTIATHRHDGDGEFEVYGNYQGDGYNQIFVETTGPYQARDGTLVLGGEYDLAVTADGPWETRFAFPRPDTAPTPPASFDGTGTDVVGPLEFEGRYRAVASHDGSGEFGVYALPPDGSRGRETVSTTGAFERAEETFPFTGIGYLNVEASGEWTLRIEATGR